MATSKVILVTNSAGKKKYGPGNWNKILKAVNGLIAADRKRGIESKVFQLDSISQMKSVGGKAVSKASSAMQTKRAIDAIFKSLRPHYLMILGGPDLIPHVELRNPIADGEDQGVPSDLPYACDRPYAKDIEKFKGPSRVLGRLPDIPGDKDPSYLIALLKTATNWKNRPTTSYKTYFGLSAEVWKGSTRASVRKLFKTTKKLNLVPPEGLPWTKTELGARMHFINCHGADIDHRFFGEDTKKNFPIAHQSVSLQGVKEGTVVAAECCFGAQVYQPLANVPMAICNRYLQQGCYGFVGSTNIAYGPADGNGLADLICIFFLRGVQNGASLGRAMLQARQDFLEDEEPVGPHALKTLAQFNLLGDPSIHPVKKSKTKKETSTAKVAQVAANTIGFLPKSPAPTQSSAVAQSIVGRSQRRQSMHSRGLRMAEATIASQTAPKATVPSDLRKQMLAIVKQQDLGKVASMDYFELEPVDADNFTAQAPSKSMGARDEYLAARPRFLVAVLYDETTAKKSARRTARLIVPGSGGESASIIDARLLVAKERNGRIQSFEEYFAR